MKRFQNKVAVITGGNSGIGYAAAKEFQAQGVKVVITGRKQEAVDAAAKELGVEGIVSDQGDLNAIDALVHQVKEKTGKVDILFINAGVAFFMPIEHVTEDHFDQMMDVNFKGAYFTLSKFLPILNDGAAVTFLSSVSATTGMGNSSVYSASKAAMTSLARVASSELAARGIRVNAVHPGPISTPIFSKTGMDEATMNEMGPAIMNSLLVKRLGTAEEVAKLVVFLSSEDAGFITGAEYVIDGGANVNQLFG